MNKLDGTSVRRPIHILKKGEKIMFETVIYKLVSLDGDYAVLVSEDGIENRVARALLPPEADAGCVIKWENLEYEIIG